MSAAKTLLRPFAVPGQDASLKIVRGQGSYVYDSAGRGYLDAAGSLWTTSLGLGYEPLLARMKMQMDSLAYASLFDESHPMAELLSDKLVKISNGEMRYAYLSTTGSSAVEVALTVAEMHHYAKGAIGRTRILAFDRSYHGCSYLTRTASGLMQRELEDWNMTRAHVTIVPSPADEVRSLDTLSVLLAGEGRQFACLLMEPILGSGGIIVPSRQYCTAISELCRQHGVLLIADEVATGVGRCGAFFASTLLGLQPDIIALSKNLTGGYFPLGATLFSERVIEPLLSRGLPVPFGSTQDGNPIGCAAALATIETVLQNGLLEHVMVAGHQIRSELADFTGGGIVAQVRGLGLMIGIELVHPPPENRSFTEEDAARVRRDCREEGLLVYHFDSGISLFPPLTVTDDEVSDLLDILREVLLRQY